MSQARRPSSFPLFQLLLLVGLAEVVINRIAVEGLGPAVPIHHAGMPDLPVEDPAWHAALSNVGLFIFYLASLLAAGALALRGVEGLRDVRTSARPNALPRSIALLALAAIAAFAVATPPADFTAFLLEILFEIVVVATVAGAVLRSTDLAASVGLLIFASPLLIHFYGTIFKHSLMSPDAALGSELPETVQHLGLIVASLAALASPYCFAPRPLTRSLPRPVPLVTGLAVLTAGAVLVRVAYGKAMFLVHATVGIDLGPGLAASEMALMLLAIATLAWTLTSCALAPSEARRELGLGLALIAMGGYGFAWPLAFLLGAAGLIVIGDALPRLGAEGGAGARTPPIDDAVWQAYVAGLTAALREPGEPGEPVTAVTTRRDDDTQATIVVTRRAGARVELRLERIGGALARIDLLCGEDAGDGELPALTLAARRDGWTVGAHPAPPPAAPAIRTGDETFDRRFDCNGDGKALYQLLDDGLRTRAAATVDGWIAYWPGHALRWRLYPGLGSPLDHPVPIPDLVMKRAGTGAAARLASVVELVAEIAARGELAAAPPPGEPAD